MFDVKVIGADAVIAMLKDYRGKKAPAAIRKASRAGCKVIAKKARDIVPEVERSDKTKGQWRRAIKVRAIKRNSKGFIGAKVIVGQGDFKGDTFYASIAEWGSKHAAATHYMKRAADESEGAAVGVALAVLKTELNKG